MLRKFKDVGVSSHWLFGEVIVLLWTESFSSPQIHILKAYPPEVRMYLKTGLLSR